MRCDHELDQVFQRDAHVWGGFPAVNARSAWNLVAETQSYRVLEETDFELTVGCREWYTNAHARLGGSQITEDAFNRQKNDKPYKNRRIAATASYMALLEPPLASTKFSYNDVTMPAHPCGRDLCLPTEAYQVCFSDQPKPFLTVMSSRPRWSKPLWSSGVMV